MNLVQLQDMLKGMPDDRLKTEMDQPTGVVPQYLVLSEIVRRDKARSASNEAPKTTVVEDVMNQANMGGIGAIPQEQPMPEDQMAQEEVAQYANGGFVTPAESMGNAGFAGYPAQQPKQPLNFGFQSNGPGMFTPNTNPAPQPMTNNTFNVQQPMQQDPNMQQEYADGGIVSLAKGGMPKNMTPEMAALIQREAARLGIDPLDLATAISYETVGTFSPTIRGPKTKWGRHIGLIQMGEPQRKQYGYDPNGSLSDQMTAVGNYLADRGVKPGMNLLDVYSTINAGAPGLYNRSDTKAGGAPGTVKDKVTNQMAGHREKAMNLLSLLGQNAGDMIMGTPTGMAGRETTAGLGQGAGQAAIGLAANQPAIAGGTVRQGGIMDALASTFGDKKTQIGSDLQSLGASMAQGQQQQAPALGQLKQGDTQGVMATKTSPEEELAQYAQLRQSYLGYSDGGAVRMADGTPYGGTNVSSTIAPPPAEAPREDQRGWWEWLTGVSKEEAADKREQEAMDADAEQARILYASDPAYRARINRQRGPLKGDAVSPSEAREIAAKSQPSAFQYLIGSQERQQKMLQDYYDQLIELEKQRMSDSGGFAAFLREMGRGMLSDNSSLANSIRAGAAQATGSREDKTQAARDKMMELQLAKKKAEIEGLGALDQLRYKHLAGDPVSARERLQYGLSPLASQLKALAEAGIVEGPEVDAIKAAMNQILADAGISVPTTKPKTEAESESGFWSIIGK